MPGTVTMNRRLALAGLAASSFSLASAQAATPKTQHVSSPLLGNATAPKRLILWGSLTCPFTAMLVSNLIQIQKDMPKLVSIEWRHFPTHPPDPGLHVAALAFTGPTFWSFISAVLHFVYAADGQYAGLTDAKIVEIAKSLGGTQSLVEAAWANKAKWSVVRSDLIAGRLMGVTKTPGLFYNGYFLTPDGIPVDANGFDRSLRSMVLA